ncbi:MAG: cupin domain-containing protein [Acidobacteria bacterium]|nr:cupin domain-containing protein [Acidobacteriota bacterium]
MRQNRVVTFFLLLALSYAGLLYFGDAAGASGIQQQQPAPSMHTLILPDQIQWGAAPAGLPTGAQTAVLQGDPMQPGTFTIRAKFPNGYKVAPHWHPTDETIVVLQGTLMMGVGEKFSETAARAMPQGAFSIMPKETRHFIWANGETVTQVHGEGPFEIHYVNPADDPRMKAESSETKTM